MQLRNMHLRTSASAVFTFTPTFTSHLTARLARAPHMPSQFPPFFSVVHCPLGLVELQACPLPDVVFPSLPLSALCSSPFHCALHNGFGQTWWTGHKPIPLQFAFLYNGQEVFMWSSCMLNLGTDFLVGNVVIVWDAWYFAVAPHFHGLYSSFQLCCGGPWFTSTRGLTFTWWGCCS